MSWWNEFADGIQCDAPLGPLTWFRLGGSAQYLFRPRSAEQLAALVARARQEGVSVNVLGSGANVLIGDDGVEGVVVRLDHEAFRKVRWHGTAVEVGAGVDLMPFSRRCAADGFSGLECMAGIPATIGGAIRMNAGGRFGDIGDVVESVDLLGADATIETWTSRRVGFEYRSTQLGDRIVLSARIDLVREDAQRVLATYEDYFAQKNRSQPLSHRSAGCIFKNPPGQSAGAMIDRIGLKGMRCGHAQVSERHANFIVTEAGATADDVIRLIDLIRDRVRREVGTELELEVDVWRRRGERSAA